MSERLTRSQAIRKHCVECSGGSVYEANKCTVKQCFLWSYRRGKGWEDPETGKIEKKAVSEKTVANARKLSTSRKK